MKSKKEPIVEMVDAGRDIAVADFNDPELGPLKLLPGTWKTLKNWN